MIPASGTTFGHIHGDEEMPDPSSVDEVGRPGVTGRHTPGEGKHNR